MDLKITVGKNESHEYLRVRYAMHYAEVAAVEPAPKHMSEIWCWGSFALTLLYAVLIRREIAGDPLTFAAIYILQLPLHELCHALFLWLTGRRVYAIRLWPYKRERGKKTAYVRPELYPFTRTAYGLLAAFPLILLSALPLLAAIAFPSLRYYMIWLALLNLGGSAFDACDLVKTAKAPKGAYNIEGNWCVPEEGETIILKRMRVKLGATSMADIERTDFRMKGKYFEEIPLTDDDLLLSMLEGLKEEYQLTDEEKEKP